MFTKVSALRSLRTTSLWGHPWGTPAILKSLVGSHPPQESRFCWDFEPLETPQIVGAQKTHS
jgi:hypothetical protein